MNKLLIIGGSDAGISAALRAKELDLTYEVTVMLEDEFPNYSICGLPSMENGFAMEQFIKEHSPRTALIVGAGYIGLEMADALTLRGLSVTLVEHGPSVLKTIDVSLGTLLYDELLRHNVTIKTRVAVQQINQGDTTLHVFGSPDLRLQADLVLIATGVEPRTELAIQAGIDTGTQGAIRVTRSMETNIPDVYAAGDCVETWHRLLQRPAYLPLGTTSHKQGRVAGANVLGQKTLFAGTLGTQVVKVFGLVAARTGLRDDEAQEANFEPLTVEGTYWDHKVYYPHAQQVHIRLTGDRTTGRLLGAQMVGAVQTEVAKRIDIIATALYHDMTVDALSDLDLSYTPPLGSPWDVVQMIAQDWCRTA